MELACEFITEWYQEGVYLYTCRITSASLNQPNKKIKVIRGVHEAMKNDTDVKRIVFTDTVVRYFPRGLNKIFPNLTHLAITKCGLEKITHEDLIGLEPLEDLCLVNNLLIELPNDLFKNMPNLKVISFYLNKLERLSSKLLEPLLNNKVTWVDFEKNTKIDMLFDLSDNDKSSVPSLLHLMIEIDKNCLVPIESKLKYCKEEAQSKYMEMITKGFAELWTSSNYSDFIIVVGSREFRVHKNVLAMQSSVFKEIFIKDTNERQQNSVKMENLKAVDVEEFLRYLYTGKIQDNANTIQLYAMASNFNVTALKLICEERILSDLDDSNAMEVFMLGHRHLSENFKQSAFEEIKKMFPDRTLSNDLIDKPERLKKMVDAKLLLDSLFDASS